MGIDRLVVNHLLFFVSIFFSKQLKVLDSEPNINIAHEISELLDGLFQILDDSNPEIKKM